MLIMEMFLKCWAIDAIRLHDCMVPEFYCSEFHFFQLIEKIGDTSGIRPSLYPVSSPVVDF